LHFVEIAQGVQIGALPISRMVILVMLMLSMIALSCAFESAGKYFATYIFPTAGPSAPLVASTARFHQASTSFTGSPRLKACGAFSGWPCSG
jgi:hypothetical protein